ncbi:hypothetical protein [Xanthomonas arboricola]|uniref:hypothetical protein n=1 Tax=Xanthomonas arboricola TaxID=56448 RepID=UPI000ACF3DD3|nr:hypothetical protein [Xanthomonas arboricola]
MLLRTRFEQSRPSNAANARVPPTRSPLKAACWHRMLPLSMGKLHASRAQGVA